MGRRGSGAYFVLVVALAAAAARAAAQDIEPRSYSNAPVGVNFAVAGYGYADGGVAADPSLPLTNAEIKVHSAFLAYARSLDVFGRSGKFDVLLPYAWLKGTAELAGQPHEREVSGFGDPKFRFTVNFYGAPALSLKEFASYRQDLIVGASLQVSAPWGQYDSSKLVNIGTNRWSAKRWIKGHIPVSSSSSGSRISATGRSPAASSSCAFWA